MSRIDPLGIAMSGLAGVNRAIAVVSQNIANANTAGYVHESAVTREAGAAGIPMGITSGLATRDLDVALQGRLFGAQASASGAELRSQVLGAIYPPMQYSIMAMDVLGYPADHPLRVEAIRHFDNLMVTEGEDQFFQPCFSPVWDTAIGGFALGEAGYGDVPAMQKATDWLLARCLRCMGQREQAMATLEDGLRRHPGSAELQAELTLMVDAAK